MPSSSRLASPWTRDLRTGAAVRFADGQCVAAIWSDKGSWSWSTIGDTGSYSTAEHREIGKKLADAGLRSQGFSLVNVPGGCTIETDEPKKPQRVYREG